MPERRLTEEEAEEVANFVSDKLGTKTRGAVHMYGLYDDFGRLARTTTPFAGKLARGVGKRLGPLVVAANAIDAANLAVNDRARKQAVTNTEKMTDDPAILRAAKGFIDPVNTAYGMANMVIETNDMANKELLEAAEPDSRYVAKKKKAAMIKKARIDDASFAEAVERRLNKQA